MRVAAVDISLSVARTSRVIQIESTIMTTTASRSTALDTYIAWRWLLAVLAKAAALFSRSRWVRAATESRSDRNELVIVWSAFGAGASFLTIASDAERA